MEKVSRGESRYFIRNGWKGGFEVVDEKQE